MLQVKTVSILLISVAIAGLLNGVAIEPVNASKPTFHPPREDAPRRTTGGGSRSEAKDDRPVERSPGFQGKHQQKSSTPFNEDSIPEGGPTGTQGSGTRVRIIHVVGDLYMIDLGDRIIYFYRGSGRCAGRPC